jgi:hypothetical protein
MIFAGLDWIGWWKRSWRIAVAVFFGVSRTNAGLIGSRRLDLDAKRIRCSRGGTAAYHIIHGYQVCTCTYMDGCVFNASGLELGFDII